MARVIQGPGRVVTRDVVGARDEAAQLREAARRDADELRARAREEAFALRAGAEEEGRAEGLATAAALVLGARAARARAVEEAERAVVALVTTIAGRVLGDTLAAEPERVVPAVRAHLEPVRRARRLELRVHPEDAPALERALREGALPVSDAVARIELDPSVTRGGCVVSSDLGTIDARLEVQLAAFERALRERP
jgi:flagellar biosynthesis/type III secretory pathway protein FliH